MYALLLTGSDLLSIDQGIDISFGNEVSKNHKIQPNSQEAGTGYFKQQWNGKDITKKMASITIHNKSETPQYGGYYWQYFENLDKITSPVTYQISIQKELFLKSNSANGKQLQKIRASDRLRIGDLITVRI